MKAAGIFNALVCGGAAGVLRTCTVSFERKRYVAATMNIIDIVRMKTNLPHHGKQINVATGAPSCEAGPNNSTTLVDGCIYVTDVLNILTPFLIIINYETYAH